MNKFSIDSILDPIYGSPAGEVDESPIIGITTNSGGEDFSLRQRYCEQVLRAGGYPVLLPPTGGFQGVQLLDAIIFTGGGDHNPLWMNEEPSPELGGINPQRDSHELPLCRIAYNNNLPMLGICRGMQTLAIALNGHVAQNIKSRIVKHSQDAPKTEPTHTINIEPQSALSSLYGSQTYVNSFHHQAVDNCGDRFRATAYAMDGVIEAMESAEHRPIMGVQWHPEQMGDDGLPIFQWLVREAAIFRKAKQLHQRIITIDSHCDTPMFFHIGQNGTEKPVNFLSRDPRILYDLHKMREGHIDAVQMVCYLPQPKIGEKFSDNIGFKVDGPAAYVDLIFDRIESFCGDYIQLASSPAEIARNKREGRRSIVLGIENGLAIEHDLRNLQRFKQRGITYMTLCHNGDNDICDSARGCNTHNGLSSFGHRVIEEMNRLGIIVDMSHAGETSFYQALEVSQKPIVCSHSNCRALCDHPRNLTDDQMRALAQHGGVMQLTLYEGFVKTSGKPDINDFLAHLEHAIDIMGIDHVGIGTDFDGDGGLLGLANAAELINLTMHLIRRGYTSQDIEKIWGKNWMRIMAMNNA